MRLWNTVFLDFWFFMYKSSYRGRKNITFPTPINSVKIESAMLYVLLTTLRDVEIFKDIVNGSTYDINTLLKILFPSNSFYKPFNYKDYVYLNEF